MGNGKLHGIVKPRFGGGLRHVPPVGGDADKPALARLAGGLQRLMNPLRVLCVGQGLDIVQLEDIHIIRLKHLQALVQVFQHLLARLPHALSGNDNGAPPVMKRLAQLFFAVRIGPSGVIVIDSRVIRHMQQLHGALDVDALNGQRAKRIFGNHQASAAQFFHFHKYLRSFCSAPQALSGFARALLIGWISGK